MPSNQIETLSGINRGFEQKEFLEAGIHTKALSDFKFMCNKLGYTYFSNLKFQKLSDNSSRNKGEYMVLGFELSQKVVYFPKYFIDMEDPNQGVAVVVYDNGNVEDVLIFKSEAFKKTGMFSMFKYDKNSDMLGVAISNLGKLKQYSFGYVLKNI